MRGDIATPRAGGAHRGLRVAKIASITGAMLGALVAVGSPAVAAGADSATTASASSVSAARPNVGSDEEWIEYDRSSYCLYLHRGDDVVWKTCRTSNGKPDTPTILGNYRVYSKVYGPICMHPPDGSETCDIHYVTYWGPGGYAFHEAWWMGSRVNQGISHGCVNMRASDAAVVFDFAYVGMRVWVHA